VELSSRPMILSLTPKAQSICVKPELMLITRCTGTVMVIVLFVPSVMVMFVGCRVGVGVCVGVVVGCGVVVLDGLGVAVVVGSGVVVGDSVGGGVVVGGSVVEVYSRL
jgi:hypothetical protein